MNARQKFSVVILVLGIIMAMIPGQGRRSFKVKPDKLLVSALDPGNCYSVDQVAKFLATEDSTIQIIDLRSPEEFRNASLPGSTNIPYNSLADKDPSGYLAGGNIKNVFYSNDDLNSASALVMAKGFGFNNTFVMTGGMNEWFRTIMNSTFTGESITAKENALYENRTRAKKLFTEMNSLPDSMKTKFLNSKKGSKKKLDGGCE